MDRCDRQTIPAPECRDEPRAELAARAWGANENARTALAHIEGRRPDLPESVAGWLARQGAWGKALLEEIQGGGR